MILEWFEQDDLGNKIRRNTSGKVTMQNCGSFANKNCRVCYGKGYLSCDEGVTYEFEASETGHSILRKVRKNEYVQTCFCTDRALLKIENAKIGVPTPFLPRKN